MVWSDPNEVEWEVGDPVTSADMKQYVRDNLLALRALNVAQTSYKPGANITTNSNSFVDADPTNLKVSLDITSDKLLCICSFRGRKSTANSGYFDLIVNESASVDVRAGDVNDGLIEVHAGANTADLIIIGYWTGLDEGTKEIKLQMRSDDANNVNVYDDFSVVLTAFEV